jgi:hypothetical protein
LTSPNNFFSLKCIPEIKEAEDLMIRLSGFFFFSAFLLAAVPVILLCILISSSWADHKVGEPKLENLSIWKECCSDHDCVPQDVQTIRKKRDGNIAVKIEGIQTDVSKEKFSPVPSQRTWVCYVNPNGEIKNENIRCILYPQTGGTTDAPQLPHSKTAGNTTQHR